MAMQLIHFENIDSKSLHPASVKQTKDEKAAEITHQTVLSTKKLSQFLLLTIHQQLQNFKIITWHSCKRECKQMACHS